LKISLADPLTVVVCEIFLTEASMVIEEQGWEGVNLEFFPACCGQPQIAVEKLGDLVKKNNNTIVVGGSCLESLCNTDGLRVVHETNCFAYICGSAQVQQLLHQGAFLVSSGWLSIWRDRIESFGAAVSQSPGIPGKATRKVVFLDTLTDDRGKANFDEYLRYTGLDGQHIEVGRDLFSLHLYRVVSEWHRKIVRKHLREERGEYSHSSFILGFLASLKPATSLAIASKQLIKLFQMFMEPEDVGVEIISNAVTEFHFDKDSRSISLIEFSGDGVYVNDSIKGFYLLVTIDEVKSAVLRIAGINIEEKINDYRGIVLSLKGLIRFIVYNAILYDELHTEIVHKAQIEKILEKSEHHFRFLYENAPLPYHCLDGSGRILEVNNAWLNTLGYKKSDVVGQLFDQFLTSEFVTEYHSFQSRLAGELEPGSVELQVVKNDSTVIHIQLDATTSKDSEDVIQQTHCIFVDISEQNRMQELILQSEKLSTIAGLAAGIAHEINTPLSGIMQSAQLIEMFLDPTNEQSVRVASGFGVDLEVVREYIKHQDLDYFIAGIRDSAIKASEIIKNLLEFSRPTEGEWVSIRLPHLFDRIVTLIRSDYDLKKKYNVINVAFETEYDSNLPFVYCVAMEMEQVFFNVIKNAVHAMGKAGTEDPRVVIRTSLRKQMVHIEIEDNGPGIGTETMKYAFDPFFTTKDPGEGTGLGLSISYAIVTGKHNGLMWVDPVTPIGTKIIIEFPAEANRPSIS
jgi:PAS domain S-box-containing protein